MKDKPDWPMLYESDGWMEKHLMSNFDHEVDQEVAQELRKNQVMAKYAGWNFNADCWFADDGQYHAAVYCCHVHQETMHAKTPEELMKIVSNAYGWE